MNTYDFSLNPRAFKAMSEGRKTSEIRVTTKEEPFDYAVLKAKDCLRFHNLEDNRVLRMTFVSSCHYPDPETLLQNEDIKVTMSSTDDPVIGAERIRAIEGYAEGIIENGVWCLRLCDPILED